ncbi:hypothetical protein LLE49_19580 [Alicyclobacillus tolerans]|uniref:hypothetical protein n=1 Tax=Alicyclobacillus tolerans TaxID=90970 RepID=UPI001F2AE721|nr:hypothetical protein [Alicyclobacillus tolerans]MCF8566924.1 hypothetical protein [Alicyclobacillus tolerans]
MFWFLYDSTGTIKEKWETGATEWTNLNGYAGAVSFALTDTTAQDAYANPSRYTVQKGALVAQPYWTLTNTSGTITATLNNPPATPPTSCTFTVCGQTYTETVTNGTATLTLQVHPSVANQQIDVAVSTTGCVDGVINIGGSSTDVSLQVIAPSGGTPTVGPVGTGAVRYLQTFYAINNTTIEALMVNASTGINLLLEMAFVKQMAAMRLIQSMATYLQGLATNPWAPSTQDKSDLTTIDIAANANENNTVQDLLANVIPQQWTTLANAYPSGATKQMQYNAFVANFETGASNVSEFMQALATFPGCQ